MQYMIVERFREGRVKDLYQRFAEKGRMLPEGVAYINSWVNEDITVCYQLMEASSPAKLREWIRHWDDLADFEIIRVISSGEATQKLFGTG